jgi:hypothetical protein
LALSKLGHIRFVRECDISDISCGAGDKLKKKKKKLLAEKCEGLT